MGFEPNKLDKLKNGQRRKTEGATRSPLCYKGVYIYGQHDRHSLAARVGR